MSEPKVIHVGPQGFVRLVDTMGGDDAIVQAARVSYGKGTKTPSDDRTLIRYLMRHRHTTPFEMAVAKFHVKVPMDTWRHWIRHRTASVNEYSTRFSEAIDDMATTEPDAWRLQSKGNKQGSEGFLPVGEPKDFGDPEYDGPEFGLRLSQNEHAFHTQARRIYHDRLAAGIAREQARKDLPLSTYTEAYWKMDLHNLLHFLSLRLHPHAQQEIREYADAIGRLVREWCPITWEAFVDYRLGGATFSRQELEILKAWGRGFDGEVTRLMQALTKREQRELRAKLGWATE